MKTPDECPLCAIRRMETEDFKRLYTGLLRGIVEAGAAGRPFTELLPAPRGWQAAPAAEAELIRLRFALADIETLAETLAEAKRMASQALEARPGDPSRKSFS